MNGLVSIKTNIGNFLLNTNEIFTVTVVETQVGGTSLYRVRIGYVTGSTVAKYTDLLSASLTSLSNAATIVKEFYDFLSKMTDGPNVFAPTVPIALMTTTIN